MWTYALVGVVVGLWLLYRKIHFSQFKKLGIPGPEPNILFGNTIEIWTKSPLECHKEWIAKYGKIVGYYFGTMPVLLVADIELLKQIQVSEFHKFINRPNITGTRAASGQSKTNEGFSQHLIALRDKRWKEIRSIITPSFTASKMKQMAPIMNDAIDSLIANVDKKSKTDESFDIYPMYQGLTMDIIGRTAFGMQTDVQNDPDDLFLQSAKVLLAGDLQNPLWIFIGSFRTLGILWAKLARLRLMFLNKGTNPIKYLLRTARKVIELRRKDKKNRRPDLLQLMMDAEIDDISSVTSDDLIAKDNADDTEKKKTASSGRLSRRMTDSDVLDNSVIFLLAGYTTTSNALAFTTHLLVHYPEVQDKIREEIQQLLSSEGELDYYSVNKLQYLDQVLSESLRIYPPVILFVNRECAEDVDLGKVRVTKGMSVQIPVFNVQRDREYWGPDADEFKPERFHPENKSKINPLAFQAFGAGPRNCVGMRFAIMEAKLTLARLLSKYRLEQCVETDKKDISLNVRFAAITPLKGIWMKAIPV